MCKKFLSAATKAQDMAYYVSSIYLTRPDVKDAYLPEFILWAHEVTICLSKVVQLILNGFSLK